MLRALKRNYKPYYKCSTEHDISPKNITPQEMLQLAAEVYEGLSETDVDEIEEIALKRDYFLNFF